MPQIHTGEGLGRGKPPSQTDITTLPGPSVPGPPKPCCLPFSSWTVSSWTTEIGRVQLVLEVPETDGPGSVMYSSPDPTPSAFCASVRGLWPLALPPEKSCVRHWPLISVPSPPLFHFLNQSYALADNTNHSYSMKIDEEVVLIGRKIRGWSGLLISGGFITPPLSNGDPARYNGYIWGSFSKFSDLWRENRFLL